MNGKTPVKSPLENETMVKVDILRTRYDGGNSDCRRLSLLRDLLLSNFTLRSVTRMTKAPTIDRPARRLVEGSDESAIIIAAAKGMAILPTLPTEPLMPNALPSS